MSDERAPGARDRRRYISQAASALCHRCDDMSLLARVRWDTLAELPTWCLLDDEALERMQRLCGAVYLLPVIQRSLDGDFLKQVRTCLGEPAFKRLLRMDVAAPVPASLESGLDPLDSIRSAGSAVLLGTLPASDLRQIFLTSLGRPAGYVAPALAERLHLLAAGIDMSITGRSADKDIEAA